MTEKTERVLKLLAALLDTRRPLSARDIQERVEGYSPDHEAFRRTFERDKKLLREDLGVPLVIEPVPGTDPPVEGYRVPGDQYRLPDPGLEPDELAAINLAAHRVRLEGSDPATGLLKLGGFAGETSAADDLATLPASPHAPRVFQAFSERRALLFRYGGTDRRVDPHRLHLERGQWYLRGHDHTRGELRHFRLDRVEGTIELDGPDTITVERSVDAPIDLTAWTAGDDEPVRARVRIDPDQVELARRMVNETVEVEQQADGGVVLSFDVVNRAGLRSFVIGFLDHAEVLAPPELRREMVAWLEALAGEGS